MLTRKLYSTGLLLYCSLLITTTNVPNGTVDDANRKIDAEIKNADKPVFILPDFDFNPSVLPFAKEYIKKNSWGLERLRKISRSRLTAIHSVFEKNGIPVELKYLAIVESNLNTDTVCNSSGATGMWQLMPETACELGLKINDERDDRLHVYKSSVAVAKYLKQLYNEFGDWLLVVAAYNAGPAKVTRAIRQSGYCNFWQLQDFLPTETRNHAKRFISVLYFFEEQNKSAIPQNNIAKI